MQVSSLSIYCLSVSNASLNTCSVILKFFKRFSFKLGTMLSFLNKRCCKGVGRKRFFVISGVGWGDQRRVCEDTWRNLPRHAPSMSSLCDFAALTDNTLSAGRSTWNPELCAACMQPPWLEHPVTGSSSFCELCCRPLTPNLCPWGARLHRSPRSLVLSTCSLPALWWVTCCWPNNSRPAPAGPTQQTPLLSCDWTIPPPMSSDPFLS